MVFKVKHFLDGAHRWCFGRKWQYSRIIVQVIPSQKVYMMTYK